MSINKNGVIVDPGGYIFEQAESLIEKFYRFVLRLPNTQPLLFQIGGCEPRSILDGGKDNRAWYATHMFVCFYPSGEDFGSKFLAAEDFHIVEESNHGVILEIVLRDMFKNSLGKLRSGNDFDFRVGGLCVFH